MKLDLYWNVFITAASVNSQRILIVVRLKRILSESRSRASFMQYCKLGLLVRTGQAPFRGQLMWQTAYQTRAQLVLSASLLCFWCM